MSSDSNKTAESNISGKSAKASYETPVIIPLGELVRGSGNCSPGSSPTTRGGQCRSGGTAGGQCQNGTNPQKKCKAGSIK